MTKKEKYFRSTIGLSSMAHDVLRYADEYIKRQDTYFTPHKDWHFMTFNHDRIDFEQFVRKHNAKYIVNAGGFRKCLKELTERNLIFKIGQCAYKINYDIV